MSRIGDFWSRWCGIYRFVTSWWEDEGEVYLYRYEEDENGLNLQNIEDDEEFELVSEAFYELFKDELYDGEYEYLDEDYDEEFDEYDEYDEDEDYEQ